METHNCFNKVFVNEANVLHQLAHLCWNLVLTPQSFAPKLQVSLSPKIQFKTSAEITNAIKINRNSK